MNIIFGKEQADGLANTHTVLELDTFQIGVNGPVATAYCVIENIPLEEMLTLIDTQGMHQQLITAYQTRKWAQALELITTLTNKWNGELDSFYQELSGRIQQYLNKEPALDWTPIIQK